MYDKHMNIQIVHVRNFTVNNDYAQAHFTHNIAFLCHMKYRLQL